MARLYHPQAPPRIPVRPPSLQALTDQAHSNRLLVAEHVTRRDAAGPAAPVKIQSIISRSSASESSAAEGAYGVVSRPIAAFPPPQPAGKRLRSASCWSERRLGRRISAAPERAP